MAPTAILVVGPLLYLVQTVNAFFPTKRLTGDRVSCCVNPRIHNGVSKRKTIFGRVGRFERLYGQADGLSPDYANEETLMKIRFKTKPHVSLESAATALSTFCQSFPFAAVLPVQPLQYLPTPDDGVEVNFLRKKTAIKSGVEGGIRFFVARIPTQSAADTAVLDSNEDGDTMESEDDAGELDITAKRNSLGQSIAKIMSEKLIVTAFLDGLTNEEENMATNEPYASVFGNVTITSIFHKWM